MTDHDLLMDLQRRVEVLESLGSTSTPQSDAKAINFSLNQNAFVNRYAHGKSGKEKFTWLIAFLAKGDEALEVPLKDVEHLWNRMTAQTLLGMKFNRKYPNEAKTKGWVDSAKTGHYCLAAGWYEIYDDGSEG